MTTAMTTTKEEDQHHQDDDQQQQGLLPVEAIGTSTLRQWHESNAACCYRYERTCNNNESIMIRKVLGEGSFASVLEVSINNNDTTNVAVKLLKRDMLQKYPLRLMPGAKALQMEAKLLNSLPEQHPNIIRVHGSREGSLRRPLSQEGAYLVMDVLLTTLDKQILVWKHEQQRAKKRRLFIKKRASAVVSDDTAAALLYSRLSKAAIGIASGLEFLHANQILHRDVKPANVGFDRNGVVKIFDFGLSCRVRKDGCVSLQNKKPVGTPRYMAPEVVTSSSSISSSSYGVQADVYSFSILLWELVTLKKAYKQCGNSRIIKLSVVRGERPSLRKIPFRWLHKLLVSAWEQSPTNRPTMHVISKVLEKQLDVMDDDSERTSEANEDDDDDDVTE